MTHLLFIILFAQPPAQPPAQPSQVAKADRLMEQGLQILRNGFGHQALLDSRHLTLQAKAIYAANGKLDEEFRAARLVAVSYNEEMRHEESRRAAEDMLAAARRVGSRFWEASALTTLGVAEMRLMNLEPALNHAQQAYKILSEPAVQDEPRTIPEIGFVEHALAAFAVGAVYNQTNQPRDAVPFLTEALEASEQARLILEGPGIRLVIARELGIASLRTGEPMKAISYLEPVLEATPQKFSAPAATAHFLLGDAYVRLRQLSDAQFHVERGLEIVRKIRNPQMLSDAYMRLGRIAMARGDTSAAEGFFQKSSNPELLTEPSMTALGDIYRGRGNFNEALLQYEKAIGVVERRVLDRQTTERNRLNLFELRLAPYLRAVDVLLRLHFNSSVPDSDYGRRAFQANLRIRNRMFADHLAAAWNNSARPPELPETSVEQIQNMLPPNTALLEYSMGPFRAIFVLTHDDFQIVPLQIERLGERAATFVAVLSQGSNDIGEFGKAGGLALFNDVLEPALRKLPNSISHLIISPSSGLEMVPFEAFPTGPDGRFLIEKFSVSYLPAASSLSIILRRQSSSNRRPFLAFADPSYDVSQNSSLIRGIRDEEGLDFRPLPYTKVEVDSIAQIIGREGSDVFLGPEASETRLKKLDLTQYRILHFATHAIGSRTNPELSALVLAMSSRDSDDGFLQVPEIYNLRLNADMVVLSACQTGQGGGAPGEGVHGISRAFFFAGARSLVASIWKVEDESTAALMTAFYGYLREGLSKAESLRRAKLDLIREGYSQPRQWAGFVLFGEADEPVSIAPISATPPPSSTHYVRLAITWLAALAGVILLGSAVFNRL